MKTTLTRQYLKAFLILFLLVSTSTIAQTPLSPFFTKEEVEIWKQRAKSGPYKSFGDVQANSPGDWDRIMANANKFVSNPSVERWKGVPTSGCAQVSVDYAPATNGKLLRDAAFAYLITGNANYKEAVRKELLAQIGEPNSDFSVRSKWCDGILHDLPPAYEINDWLTRLLFGYAYIESGLSSEDKSRIDKWFYNAALYFQRNVDADLSKMFVNRNGGDWTPSGYAVTLNSSLGRTTHYNGYKTSSLSRYYNNRRSSQVYFFTLLGFKQNISSLKESGKRYVKEALMFATYPDGTFSEFQRWREDFADIGISYSFLTISQLVNMADYFARSGDFELYKFTTSKGAFGTQGGSKNLELLIKTMLRHMDGNLKRYGTESSSKMGTTAALIDGVNTESGRSWYTVNDTWFAQGNLYFKDSYIKDSYLRRAPGTRAYPSPGNAASAGKHKPYGGAWDVFPGVMLMYGQMDGKVWPYPGSVINPTISIAISAQPTKCYGGNEGSVTATVTGGTSPYTYLWSTGATTNMVTGLKAGEYSVVVTDKAGVKQSKSVIITQPLAITIAKAIVNETATSQGSISVTVSGGTAPYKYKWSTGATTASISGLVAGTYTITITDANTCSVSQTITLTKEISPLSVSVSAKSVICNGSSNGSATATVSGGVAPYTYAWSNGTTTAAVTGLKAGEYSVTVTDKAGVKQSKTIAITQPTAINVSETVVAETASSKGSINLTVSGGTSPYTYKWSNGATTQDLTSVSAGSYTITVTDANNCIVNKSVTVNAIAPSLSVTTSSQPAKCYGGSEGNASVSVIGGVAPYTYAWSNGATTAAVAGLKAGEYSVTVTDKAGIKVSKTVSITQPTAISINKTVSNQTDNIEGSISVTVSGGTAPYKYKWSTGATTASISGLVAGTYTITITDANTCSVSQTITLTKEISPLSVSVSAKSVICNGSSNGSATATVSGGVAPYTYAWSNGTTTAAVTGLKAGEYSVTVTDKAGVKQSKTVTVNEPSVMSMSEKTIDETATTKGSISVTVSGGTAPYKYKWSTGATTAAISGLVASTYTVNITDANNCTISRTIEIEKSTPTSMAVLSLSLMNAETDKVISAYATLKDGDTLDLSTLPTRKLNIQANTTDPNKIMKVKFGLNGNPEHRIDRFSPYSLDGDFRGDFDPWKLSAGKYSVEVSPYDSSHVKGTELKLTFYIVEKRSTRLAVQITTKQNTCNGSSNGSATATANGGTAPFSYKWSTGTTSAAISGLKAGEYTVTVSDKSGAKVTKTVTVAQPSAISINETVVHQTATAKGSIRLSMSGGTAPYKYKWSTGVAAKDLIGIVAGTYSITVTDANNCIVSKSIVVENEMLAQVAVQSLSLISVDTKRQITGFDPLQNGDTLDLSALPTRNFNIVANTTDPKEILKVKFKLNSNDNYRTERNSPYLLEGNNGDTYHALKLKPGKYTVTATAYDKKNKNGKSVTITFYLVEGKKNPLAIAINSANAGCNGAKGSATASVSGGTSPYKYKWSNGAATASVSGLKAGEYSVTVTDKAGIKVTKTVTIAQPSAISISETVVHQTASSKGSIDLTISGGTAPYKYKWSNGVTTASVSELKAGEYTVTVTDDNNCSVNETFIVRAQAVFAINVTSKDVTCNGSSNGSATATANGGTSPYSYKWSNGAITAAVSGLKAGEYSVTVTDKAGAKVNKTVTIAQPSAISINETVVHQTASSKGSINLTVNGGTAPYKYKWSTGATTQNLTNVAAGSYKATITDANNCTISKSIVVEKEQAQVAVISLSLMNAETDKVISAYATLKDGDVLELATLPTRKLSIQANTTDPKYIKKVQFSLNNTVDYHRDYATPYFIANNDGATIKPWNITPGKYTLTATPYNQEIVKGKAVTISFEIVERKSSPFVVQISAKNNECNNSAEGTATASVSGGTSPYSYKWSNGAITAAVSGLKAGEYSVTVTDKAGAKVNKTVTIAQPSAISINETVVHQTASSKGSISVTVNGGTAPYKYKWSTGATTATISGLIAGAYSVTITDANNCSINRKIDVQDSDNRGNEITPIVECVLDNGNGTFTATFGYINASAEEVTLTAGNSNFFAPAPLKGEVLEKFSPGKNVRAFTAVFKNGTSLTWTIIGPNGTKRIAVASANTARCFNIEPAVITLKPSYLFSPNEDGIDDLWVISNIEQHPDYEVIIFNRNGNKVFQAMPYTNNWDGRYQGVPLMAEAYYYVIRSATQGNIKTGTITLIR
ncbi:T9SS type B sorting domain-containing protein [Rhodocytophaga rosea]|uniref:T9SS type B sorting domain-containing protein n=1 Tax=Rhodocytophaga rosea TaxID=2704465 RepID=A0A6C0GUY5_9BACT|nr:gliding motility-associated C-terminal domain-containing protein [Rhodocytophaga rosea]QHT71624.1 T9SS type B sorting domain-containing protein [Rhodocytophaga rosea]